MDRWKGPRKVKIPFKVYQTLSQPR